MKNIISMNNRLFVSFIFFSSLVSCKKLMNASLHQQMNASEQQISDARPVAANRNLVKNKVGFITSNVSLTDCYHVYEMIWSQNSLTSLFDGNVVETKTGSYVPNLFGKTERVVLNLAVGGNFFTNFNPSQIVTGSLYVDFVKVFTSG